MHVIYDYIIATYSTHASEANEEAKALITNICSLLNDRQVDPLSFIMPTLYAPADRRHSGSLIVSLDRSARP